MDATVPFSFKDVFERPAYPMDRVGDLRKWFSEEDLAWARSQQNDYARFLARSGI